MACGFDYAILMAFVTAFAGSTYAFAFESASASALMFVFPSVSWSESALVFVCPSVYLSESAFGREWVLQSESELRSSLL